MRYVAVFHREAGSDVEVSFPDLPGCVSAGASLEEARHPAAEALSLHLAGLREDGAILPRPSSPEVVRAMAAPSGAIAWLAVEA